MGPPGGAGLSHGERDEAVVSLDVSLQDLRARPQHTLEAGPVQLHTLEWTTGDYSSRPGPVQEQGNFPWRNKKRRAFRWNRIQNVLRPQRLEQLWSGDH